VRPAGSTLGVRETRCAEVMMITYTDMSTGKKVVDLREEYGEEVLLSNWLPQPELGLGLQEAVPARAERREPPQDAEAFLRTVYLSQE
jgi:hypothetical protein